MLLLRDIKKLRTAGFTDWEIGILNENLRQRPQVLDLTTKVWQAVMSKRRSLRQRWLESGRLTEGRTLAEFDRRVKAYYLSSRKASVWDWVKLEYRPVTRITDFKAGLERRKATQRRREAAQKLTKGLGLKVPRRAMA